MSANVSSSSVTIPTAEDSTAKVDISYSASWSATSNQNWLSVNPASGTDDTTLTFTVSENTQTTKRVATVTVSVEGAEDKTIAVTQEAGKTGVRNLTEGTASIYPNPVAEGLCIEGVEEGASLVLTLLNRQVEYSCKLTAGSNYIPITNLSRGIYLVKITTPGGCIQKKLVKE